MRQDLSTLALGLNFEGIMAASPNNIDSINIYILNLIIVSYKSKAKKEGHLPKWNCNLLEATGLMLINATTLSTLKHA